MKEYPSIQAEIVNAPIYAFDKLDGSNIRAEWNRKSGFYKFGKRNGLLDDSNPVLKESVNLVKAEEDSLARVFRSERWDKVIAFFEFFGSHSFAGLHESEPHEVRLIDVAVDKRGILHPREFFNLFGGCRTARLLYSGRPSSGFRESVRLGTLPGMTFEGVVCKGDFVSPGRPLMFKIKSDAWIEKVHARYSPEEAQKLL